MKLYERIEFFLFCLFTLCLAISWDWATKALILLVLFVVVKGCWSRHWGNPALGRGGRWGMALLLSYFALNALSLLYSSNRAEGMEVLVKHLPFLLFPLVFLLSDMRYLRHPQVRTILYLFSAALSVRFLVRVGFAIGKMVQGTELMKAFVSSVFDPIHHAYLAMYTLLVLAFVYGELRYHSHPRWLRVSLWAVAGMMMAYTYCIQSRAGVVGMVVLVVVLLLHLAWDKSHRKQGLLLLGGFLMLSVAVHFAPSNRLSSTINEVSSGDKSDVRFDIWRNALLTSGQNLPWGVGIGDRMDALAANYPDSTLVPDAPLKLTHVYNPHNQYLDTLLAIGIPGELLLLSLLALPCWLWLRKREKTYYHYLLPLVLIAALSFPFESILERQMGILFFCHFYCLFFMNPNDHGYRKSQEIPGAALPQG